METTEQIQTIPDEQVTQEVITETPQDITVEENSDSEIVTQKVPDEDKTGEVKEDTTSEKTQPALTQEQLEAKLKEYELKEQEALELRNRLGIEDDSNFYLDSVEASIDNKAQQAWINLCNKFGVDYTPEGIDKSTNELLDKDPKAYYQFKAEGERLYNNVQTQKAQVHTARVDQGITQFVEANKPILEASPVVNKLIGDYINDNYSNLVNPQQQLSSLMEAIKMIYSEALEVGKQAGKIETIKKDKSGVDASSSIATTNTNGYDMQTDKVFTRQQIAKMSTEEFDKNYKLIEKLYREGKIQ